MFSSELLSIAFALLAIFYTYFKVKYQYWRKKNVPYVSPTIPFGSFQSVIMRKKGLGEETAKTYQHAIENNWKYVGIYTLMTPSLIVTDLDLLKNIMTKDFNYFTDRGGYLNEKDQPISAHLFAIGGVKWRNLRTKLSPTFTSGKMKMMFKTLTDCGAQLEKHIDEISGMKDGVDIKNILGCFSTDIIGSCAFGLECNTLKEPNSDFRVYNKKMFNFGRLKGMQMTFASGFPNLGRALGIVIFPKDVENFYNNIVRQTVEYREKNNLERKDFLQLLIDIRKNNAGNEQTGDGTNLTMDEIVAQSFVFFIAGFETSSTTMSFALFELAVNQKIQDKVREEIRRVLKKHNEQITYDSMQEMDYLQQVIDETLRMYPPVPLLTRECVNDYKVPNSDLVIDKGTRVLISVKGIHYDKNIYPNPKVFDPDRFAPGQKDSRHQYAHIPFGEGPRICIGMRFGLMQTKVGIVSVLRNHKVTVNSKTEVPLKLSPVGFIPRVIGDIWLDIEKA